MNLVVPEARHGLVMLGIAGFVALVVRTLPPLAEQEYSVRYRGVRRNEMISGGVSVVNGLAMTGALAGWVIQF